MNTNIKYILAAALLTLCNESFANLTILSCEPEWAAIATEIGGDKITVSSATNAMQDPHHVEAKPSLIAKARNADLLVCTGLELEIGWLPILLQQSGNQKIAAGQPGHFEAGEFVAKLDVPSRLDRSDGDVHASGNPHIQTSPLTIEKVATALTKRLMEIDAANADYYQNRFNNFDARWKIAMQQWEKQAARLKGIQVVEHHKNLEYLWDWLGVTVVGTLEPKPGVEPSAAHLAELTAELKSKPAKMVVRAAYQDEHPSQWLSEHAKIPAVALPFTVGGDDKSKDLFGLFDDTIALLLDAIK